MRKKGVLPLLEDLALRNTGVTSADFEDLLHAAFLPSLLHLSLGNESESLIYNFNCVGWPAMQALRRFASNRAYVASASSSSLPPPLLPRLRTLNLHGNRLSPFGASQLFSALVKQRAMPALRRLDLRNTHIGKEGLASLLKTLDRGAPPSLPPSPPSLPPPFSSSSPSPSPLAFLHHLYLSMTHAREDELRVVKALLTKAPTILPRLRLLALMDEGEALDREDIRCLKAINPTILVRLHTRALVTAAV
ncbi:Hypothetical protein NocV09_01601480 [Nannochloropsis oceanica]